MRAGLGPALPAPRRPSAGEGAPPQPPSVPLTPAQLRPSAPQSIPVLPSPPPVHHHPRAALSRLHATAHAPSQPGPAGRAGVGCTTPRRKKGGVRRETRLSPTSRVGPGAPSVLPTRNPTAALSLAALRAAPGPRGRSGAGAGWYVPLPAALAVGAARPAASSSPPGRRRHEVRGCAPPPPPRACPGDDGERG